MPVVPLDVNVSNSMKRQRLENGVLKKSNFTMCISDSLQIQRHKWVESTRMEKVFHAKSNQETARAATPPQGKTDTKTKKVRRQNGQSFKTRQL